MQEDWRTDIGRFLGLDQKRNGTELTRTSRMENGIVSLRTLMISFSESGRPVFRGSSALERGKLKSKGKRTLSKYCCGDDNTAQVVLRTIISVNQLSIYGATADMCDELAWRLPGCSESTGKPVAQNKSETMHDDANRIVDNEQNASDQ